MYLEKKKNHHWLYFDKQSTDFYRFGINRRSFSEHRSHMIPSSIGQSVFIWKFEFGFYWWIIVLELLKKKKKNPKKLSLRCFENESTDLDQFHFLRGSSKFGTAQILDSIDPVVSESCRERNFPKLHKTDATSKTDQQIFIKKLVPESLL